MINKLCIVGVGGSLARALRAAGQVQNVGYGRRPAVLQRAVGSTSMIVALGTSTPTSTTVVATST